VTKLTSPAPRQAGRRRQSKVRWLMIGVGLALSMLLAAAGSTAHATGAKTAAGFQLRIGSIMSFTGDLGPYGPSLDAAAKLAASYINQTLTKEGLAGKYSVQVVDSQDDQSKIPPAVEAATKEVDVDKVNVIVGTISSGSTIAVAQSVSIPHGILQITPTSSSPGIGSLKDHNLVFQILPSDNFQAVELVKAVGQAWGKHATVNVGWRNDDWGNGVSALFLKDWKAAGGKVGHSLGWNPDATSFDTDAQKLASGSPNGWVIFDFPPTFAKMAPALVRAGSWSPAKTFVTAEMRDASALGGMGSQATQGLHGVSSSNGSTPLQEKFAAFFKSSVKGKPFTGYEGYAFDSVVIAFLGALEADSTKGSAIAAKIRPLTNPPGPQYDYQQLGNAIKAIVAGKKIQYTGVGGPLDLNAQGAPTSERYDVWSVKNGKPATLSTHTIVGS
jgi:ABC-type branched-subunit amino acid transport system substrate-binding protein